LALIEESFSLYKELGDNAGVALALINLVHDQATFRGTERCS